MQNYQKPLAREPRNASTELSRSRLPVRVPLLIDLSINRMLEGSAAEAELVNNVITPALRDHSINAGMLECQFKRAV